MLTLADFTAKHIPGLYSFAHYEGPDGAFIQVHLSGGHWVYQDKDGARHTCYSIADLKAAVTR